MRTRLWPEADAADLEREVETYLGGAAVTTVAVAFVADAQGAGATGFIEVSLRAFADGCESMPVPHVEGWYVEPPARGRGLGTALMHAAETWARGRGFTELASDTEIHNVASARAHEACGFIETERLIKFRKALH